MQTHKKKELIIPLAAIFREEANRVLNRNREKVLFNKRRSETDKKQLTSKLKLYDPNQKEHI